MKFSQVLGGILFLCLGIFLFSLPFFIKEGAAFFIWIWAVIAAALGILILINKREDIIEEIRR